MEDKWTDSIVVFDDRKVTPINDVSDNNDNDNDNDITTQNYTTPHLSNTPLPPAPHPRCFLPHTITDQLFADCDWQYILQSDNTFRASNKMRASGKYELTFSYCSR